MYSQFYIFCWFYSSSCRFCCWYLIYHIIGIFVEHELYDLSHLTYTLTFILLVAKTLQW